VHGGGGSGGGGGDDYDYGGHSSKFLAQTYPFSAFVPVILTELQFALTRLFLFAMVPAPEAWTRHRRQQDKMARLVAAQGGNGNAMMLDTATTAAAAASASSSAMGESKRSMTPTNGGGGGSGGGGGAGAGAAATTTAGGGHVQAAAATTTAAVGNMMLNLATHAGSNINVTDFLCRNVLGLFALLCDQLQLTLQRDGLETALSKACQVAIDTTFITLSVDFYFSLLETNIDLLFGAEASDPSLVAQTQEVVLSRIRRISSQAQDLIFELLASKVDALLESLQFIDYAPEYPPAPVVPMNGGGGGGGTPPAFMVNLGAANPQWVHESVESIVDFLTITFMCFTHLPQAVREAVHFTSCAKLAQGVLDFVLSDRVARLNIYALVALDADVKRLMLFADSCGIPDLRRCFDELHEMVRAALHPDLAQIGEDASFRQKLFPHVSAEKLAQLLDKVQPSPVSASASNLPTLEKAMTRVTAKRLRSQQQQQWRESMHGAGGGGGASRLAAAGLVAHSSASATGRVESMANPLRTKSITASTSSMLPPPQQQQQQQQLPPKRPSQTMPPRR
jgi:hypothetical protein